MKDLPVKIGIAGVFFLILLFLPWILKLAERIKLAEPIPFKQQEDLQEIKPVEKLIVTKDRTVQEAIADGVKYYQNLESSIPMDSVFLLSLVSEKSELYRMLDMEKLGDRLYRQNPYARLHNINFILDDDAFEHAFNIKEFNLSSFDRAIIDAIYCDVHGYGREDFENLISFLDEGYGGTHVLGSLVIMQKNNCYNQGVIKEKIDEVAQLMVDSHDGTSSDLNSEKMASLYWAGYGELVKDEWVEVIPLSQNEDFGWGPEGVSNPHTTSLALLAMLYHQEDLDEQDFYPLSELALFSDLFRI